MQFGLEAFIPRQHKALMKKQLIEEWDHQCAYCGHRQLHKELTLDHVTPLAKMGTDNYSNLIPCCRSCNLSKGDKAIRQWYFDNPAYTKERWLKIRQHIEKEYVLAS